MTTTSTGPLMRVLGRSRRAMTEPASAMALRSHRVRVLAGIASAALAIGLFTVSWDRLLNVSIGPYNVKLPAVAFSIAALAGLPLLRGSGVLRRSRLVAAATLLTVGILAVLVLSGALSARPVAAAAQIIAVLTGAIAPAVALIAVVRDRDGLRWALRWLLAGAVLTCAFGLYQLAAFYVGLPQLIEYTGLGPDGGAGRISAFSYEPAYFANFVVLAAGAAAALAVLEHRRLGWLPVIGFAVVLVLANVRALLFLAPALCVLLALRWRINRGLLVRVVVVGIAVVLLNVGVTTGIRQAIAQAEQTPAVAVPTSPSGAQPQSPTSAPSASSEAEAEPQPAAPAPNVLDPNEQSSNAPRLALYKEVLQAVGAHPVLGVGPGNLGPALRANGYEPGNSGAQVVANNIWLQAYSDGGLLLVVLELALSVVVVMILLTRAYSPVQPLAAAWIAVLGVSGLLTSYFFDVKMWVVLGLLLVATAILPTTRDDVISQEEDGTAAPSS